MKKYTNSTSVKTSMTSIKNYYTYMYDIDYNVYELYASRDNKPVAFTIPKRYQIIKYLGGGSFGNVCSAIDNLTNEHVAIKRVYIDETQHLEDISTVLNEISVMRAFTFQGNGKKSNILPLYRILPLPKNNNKATFSEIYLVTKLYDIDLSHVIKSSKLNNTQRKYIMYNILVGLKQLHDKQILHGDIKPANIYCNINCETVVGDYGLSQRFSTNEHKSPTKLRDYIITRWYRPPELLLKDSCVYDCSVDIWSAGCVFIELFTGHSVFRGMNSIQQYYIISKYFGSSPETLWQDKQMEQPFKNSYKNYGIYTREQKIKSLKTLIPIDFHDDHLFDLLLNMLNMNPSERKSAYELLNHPYLNGFYNENDMCVPISPFKYKENYPLLPEYENIHTWTMEDIRNALWFEIHTEGYGHFIVNSPELLSEESTKRCEIINNEKILSNMLFCNIIIQQLNCFAINLFDLISEEMIYRANIQNNAFSIFSYINQQNNIINDQLHCIINIFDKHKMFICHKIQYDHSITTFRMKYCTRDIIKNTYAKICDTFNMLWYKKNNLIESN